MSIKFDCPSCGKPVEVLDELAGQKYRCRGCGNQVDVPGGTGAAALGAPDPLTITDKILAGIPGKQKKPCPKCGEKLGNRARVCFKCGWDNERSVRTCQYCERDVILNYDPGVGYEFAGGFSGVVGLIVFKLFGLLGAATAGCGLAALGSLISSVIISYRCKVCRRRVDPANISPAENEELQKRRILFIALTVVLALLAFGLGSSWVWLLQESVRSS